MFAFLLGATGMFATTCSTRAILLEMSPAFRTSASVTGLSISGSERSRRPAR